MTQWEKEQYVAGFVYGRGLVHSYGVGAVLRATRGWYVNGSQPYTAGMVDAALILVQTGVK